MIRLTPPEVVFHRVSASARKPTLLAPEWCENRWLAMTEIGRNLDQNGAQGAALGKPFEYTLAGTTIKLKFAASQPGWH